jgi:predicted small lipoprotein YifL
VSTRNGGRGTALAALLVLAMASGLAACGRYGPPVRAEQYREKERAERAAERQKKGAQRQEQGGAAAEPAAPAEPPASGAGPEPPEPEAP